MPIPAARCRRRFSAMPATLASSPRMVRSGCRGCKRARLMSDADNQIVLPDIISKEPLGPAVRQGDDQWYLIVKWTLNALIEAEEQGVTQANVDEKLKSETPNTKRLLGTTGDFGKFIAL